MESGGQGPDGEGRGRFRPLPRWVTGVSTLFDWSGRCIAVLCLGFMFVALLLNVVLRYAFGSGIAWAYEIHSLLLPWLVGGGIVIAAARGRNIAVTLLPDALGHRLRLGLLVAVNVVILIICLSVLWTSQPILKAAQFQSLSTLGIKQIWGYASLIYAFTGMAVIAVIEILRLLSGEDPGAPDRTHASLS
jgi:TRAP-type C4-dicarboxylate transport system permease small subunit